MRRVETHDIHIEGTDLTVRILPDRGTDWIEESITSEDNLIELLQWVASKGWEAYDEILSRVDTARKEAAEEPL